MRYLSGLIALINEQLGPDASVPISGNVRSAAGVQAHYRNTLGMYAQASMVCVCFNVSFFCSAEYLQNRQRDPETAEKFSAIQLS